MKKTLYILLTAALTAGAAVCVLAQDEESRARALLAEDPGRAACQLHHYETPVIRDTRPPRGYKPLYVSHFSRHGSRYMTGKGVFGGLRKPLHRADTLGILTPLGYQLMADLDTLSAWHDGMEGYLTQKGSLEHQGVARRLFKRVPRLFKQRKRHMVLAVSSTVVRCNQSMMNFGTALKGEAPGLDIVYVTNERTDTALTRVWRGSRNPLIPGPDDGLQKIDSMLHARLDPDRFLLSIFTDTAASKSCFKNKDMQRYMFNLITSGGISQCMDSDHAPDIYRYFTEDEIFDCWVVKNGSALNQHGYTWENGEVLRRVGQHIVRDILDKADEALSPDSDKVADLRFSHDGGVLPLKFFLRLGQCDTTYRIGTEWQHGWFAFEQVPMCANVQMIFYRHRRGDVIVKFLDNEKETAIAGLDPWRGPYYKWSELKPWLQKLIDIDCDVHEP